MSEPPASAPPRVTSPVQDLENDSNPETLDRIVATTTPRLWVALVAVIVLVVLGVGWMFVAQIPRQSTATGVVLQLGTRVVMPSPIAGSVRMLQTVQSSVAMGDQVAEITPFDPTQQIVVLTSPVTGIVSDVFVQDGAGVVVGQSVFVASAIDDAAVVRVISLVPASIVDTFEVGATVLVEQSATAAAVGQSDVGTITAVSTVPGLRADLEAVTSASRLAESLRVPGNEPTYMVIIEVPRDTSGRGMLDGQLVNIVNNYDYMHPIDIVLEGRS